MGGLIQNRSDVAIASNPFSTRFLRPGAIEFVFPQGLDLTNLIAAFEQSGRWCQIVGCHGSGKSTLLQSLRPELERLATVQWFRVVPRTDMQGRGRTTPYDLVSSDDRATSAAHRPSIWVVDGFDRLSWPSRWNLLRRCRRASSGLLITTHRDLGLPTLHRPGMDWPSFRELVSRLLLDSDCPVALGVIHETYDRYAPNFREALFALYDQHEKRRRKRLTSSYYY